MERARANLQPPWDEVREARVLGRVLQATEEAEQPSGARWKPDRRWPAIVVGGVAVASVVAAAAFIWAPFGLSERGGLSAAGVSDQSAEAAPAESQLGAVADESAQTVSELTFAPGIRALLEPGARVSTIEHGEQRVQLRQSLGRVRYQINPDHQRQLDVRVRHLLVRVLGTAFTIDVGGEFICISVSRGELEVVDGARKLRLAAGEELRVSLSDRP